MRGGTSQTGRCHAASTVAKDENDETVYKVVARVMDTADWSRGGEDNDGNIIAPKADGECKSLAEKAFCMKKQSESI